MDLCPSRDIKIVQSMVVEPAQRFGTDLVFVLEILGRYEYTEHGVEGKGVMKKTLADYWMPLSPVNRIRGHQC
jgi:hypothetical protein